MTREQEIQIFYQFLVSNNALFNFLKYSNFEDLKQFNTMGSFMNMSVRWGQTDEGYSYWDELYDKWVVEITDLDLKKYERN